MDKHEKKIIIVKTFKEKGQKNDLATIPWGGS
jgi:hypothetical protein